MKSAKWRRALGRAVLLLTLLVLCAASAAAQQLALPTQAAQAPAPAYQRATPVPQPRTPPNSAERTLPQIAPQASPAAPPAYQPSPAPALNYQGRTQPMLPAVFRGCWDGEVRYLDSIERLPGGAKIGPWTAKTYRLCYRRIGAGPFMLTFTEAGVAPSDRITNAAGRMTLLSTDGRSYAAIRSQLHFDEYRTHVSYFGGSTFAVDEVTTLNCRIEPDGMQVTGFVTGWHGGAPWFRARWHALFLHREKPPQATAPGGIPE